MSKRYLILVASLGILALVGVGCIFYLQSFKTITFAPKRGDISIKLQDEKGGQITTFTGNKVLRLQPGKYSTVVQSDHYDTTPVPFTVKDTDSTIAIDPTYSTPYLSELLLTEQEKINKVITDTYPQAIKSFPLRNGRLYKEGEWYATLLVENVRRSDEPDIYRTVLKKENGTWVIKAAPALVLSSKDYPDIPFDILSEINRRGKNG